MSYLETLDKDTFCLLVQRMNNYTQLAAFFESLRGMTQRFQLALSCVKSVRSNSNKNVLYTSDTLFSFPNLEEWRLPLDFRAAGVRDLGQRLYRLAGHPSLRIFRCVLDPSIADIDRSLFLSEFFRLYCRGTFRYPDNTTTTNRRNLTNTKIRIEIDGAILQVTGNNTYMTYSDFGYAISFLVQRLLLYGSMRQFWIWGGIGLKSVFVHVENLHILLKENSPWSDRELDSFFESMKPKRVYFHLKTSGSAYESTEVWYSLFHFTSLLRVLNLDSIQTFHFLLAVSNPQDLISETPENVIREVVRALPGVSDFDFIYSPRYEAAIRAELQRHNKNVSFWSLSALTTYEGVPVWPNESYIEAVDF